jgi:hypothetical protein
MQCRDLENFIAQEGLEPLPAQAREHVVGCNSCRALVADLTAIVSVANKMPAEIEPPARIWASLRNQLEIEGLIKELPQVPAMAPPAPWFPGWRDLFRSRTLATAAVGLVLAIAAVIQLKSPIQEPVRTVPPTPVAASSTDPSPVPNDSAITATRTALTQQEQVVRGMVLAGDSPVDLSLTENLKKVDEFIGECERRLKQEPRDEMARQYLYEAYQQKAELLAAMMDRGRSVN